jgi:hypothetical protein
VKHSTEVRVAKHPEHIEDDRKFEVCFTAEDGNWSSTDVNRLSYEGLRQLHLQLTRFLNAR